MTTVDSNENGVQEEYHHPMSFCRRCTIDDSNIPEDPHEVVYFSPDLLLVASGSTLRSLKELVDTIPDDAYRFLTAYSVTAVMSLLLNTVIRPLDPQARPDLELLMSFVNMCPIRQTMVSPAETASIQEHSNFLMRLVSFGTRPVKKAEKRDKNDNL